MTTLHMMIGPSGAGKSTFVSQNFKPEIVLSSDSLREQLTGDFRDQSKNSQMWGALHELLEVRLRHKLDTVVDATNLKKVDRHTILKIAGDIQIFYWVINRPMADKYRDAGWRKELDFDLIFKHEQTFNSNLREILAGDFQPNVQVIDTRIPLVVS